MLEIRNFAEANAALTTFLPTSRDRHYKLALMRRLMTFLGNPQNNLKIIHVAGTSGKTSTCYYVASLLHATGKSVGLTVSPHVTEVNERVQLNLVPLPEAEFCSELSKFLKLIESSDLQPSYFEVIVAFAYWEFARRKVDYAVIEVGLGGMLDATNVVDRSDKICVIADIGFDHVDALGHTLAAIAGQKAGIIHAGNVVFCNRQSDEVLNAFRSRVERQHARLEILEPHEHGELSFLPPFQQRNFCLAHRVVEYVLKRDKGLQLSSAQALAAAHIVIPARMEVLRRGDKVLILDASHNGQKLEALMVGIKQQFPSQPIVALIGFTSGNEYRLPDALKELTANCRHLIITSFTGQQDLAQQSVAPVEIVKLCEELHFNETEIQETPNLAFHALLARPEPILVITGSFYLLNHIRPLMLSV